MRTIVDLPDDQLDALSTFCKREQISRAEAIRRAVDDLLQKQPQGSDEAFGIWKKKKFNARSYVQKIRSEWDRK